MNLLAPFLVAAVALAASSTLCAQTPPAGPVVINEIFYHPPPDRVGLQWVELHNPGGDAVDLSDWSFSKGITFKFPSGSKLAAGGYAVVVQDAAAFHRQYGAAAPVAGVFTGHLSGHGERVEIQDAKGRVIDWVHYSDKAPWPAAPDGSGESLERVHPGSRSDIPGNWVASLPGRPPGPWGTPGRRNDAFRTNLPPIASEIKFDPLAAGRPNRVSVWWNDSDGVASADLVFQVGTEKGWGPDKVLKMPRAEGDAKGGTYAVEIPAVADGSVVRFRLRAQDGLGNERIVPAPQELAPAFSYLSWVKPPRGTIGQLHLWVHGHAEPAGPSFRNPRRAKPEKPGRGEITAILVPPEGAGDPDLHDFIRVSERAGGWKVRMGHGRTLMGMKTANVIFESEPRWVLAEHLAYEVYRRAGVPAPASGHLRVIVDGEPMGYHLYVEQPDEAFLARQGRDPDGNLYKILWYGQGVVAQHEKKNHPQTGHADIKDLIQGLASRNGDDQWKYIQEQFVVDEVVNYFVVNSCIQNWDGYFNNYFTLHAPGPHGRWEIYPWDEDKTWGDFDGAPPKKDWYSLPLTYGANGDPPANGGRFGGGMFGGQMWWRPPGWFSGPLLANPGFQKRFRARLREFCEAEFTDAKLRPVIDALEKQLEPEVRFRAGVRDAREESALRQFHEDIDSFRRQVVHRREFILKELGVAK